MSVARDPRGDRRRRPDRDRDRRARPGPEPAAAASSRSRDRPRSTSARSSSRTRPTARPTCCGASRSTWSRWSATRCCSRCRWRRCAPTSARARRPRSSRPGPVGGRGSPARSAVGRPQPARVRRVAARDRRRSPARPAGRGDSRIAGAPAVGGRCAGGGPPSAAVAVGLAALAVGGQSVGQELGGVPVHGDAPIQGVCGRFGSVEVSAS